MQRIPEPELMTDAGQVRAYAEADFAEPHDRLIALLLERFDALPATGAALDLGCGAGDISRRFATALPGWQVHGVDGSAEMLSVARQMTAADGLSSRVTYAEVLLPAPADPEPRYDLVFSNSLLHHLADPDVFWSSLRDRTGPSGRVFVMDLLRPSTREAAERFVQLYSANEPEVLQTDFYNSLLAAFEPDEVVAQLERAGLAYLPVEVVSDRHFIVWGDVRGR